MLGALENTKNSMIPDLCSQSCTERLNEHEIAKQCSVRNQRQWEWHRQQLVDLLRRKDSARTGVEWIDGLQGRCGPWGLSLKCWVGGGETSSGNEGQWHEHNRRDRKEYTVFEVLDQTEANSQGRVG